MNCNGLGALLFFFRFSFSTRPIIYSIHLDLIVIRARPHHIAKDSFLFLFLESIFWIATLLHHPQIHTHTRYVDLYYVSCLFLVDSLSIVVLVVYVLCSCVYVCRRLVHPRILGDTSSPSRPDDKPVTDVVLLFSFFWFLFSLHLRFCVALSSLLSSSWWMGISQGAAAASGSSGLVGGENSRAAVQEHQKRAAVAAGETTVNSRITGSSEYQLQFAWPTSSSNHNKHSASTSRRMPESLDSLLHFSHGN